MILLALSVFGQANNQKENNKEIKDKENPPEVLNNTQVNEEIRNEKPEGGSDQQDQKLKNQKAGPETDAVHITPGASGVKRSIGYKYSSLEKEEDPGNGIFRYNKNVISEIRYLFVDDIDLSGEDQTNWYSTWDKETGATGRGRITVADSEGEILTVFKITDVFTDENGFWKIPVEYQSGKLPEDGAVCYYVFDRVKNGDEDAPPVQVTEVIPPVQVVVPEPVAPVAEVIPPVQVVVSEPVIQVSEAISQVQAVVPEPVVSVVEVIPPVQVVVPEPVAPVAEVIPPVQVVVPDPVAPVAEVIPPVQVVVPEPVPPVAEVIPPVQIVVSEPVAPVSEVIPAVQVVVPEPVAPVAEVIPPVQPVAPEPAVSVEAVTPPVQVVIPEQVVTATVVEPQVQPVVIEPVVPVAVIAQPVQVVVPEPVAPVAVVEPQVKPVVPEPVIPDAVVSAPVQVVVPEPAKPPVEIVKPAEVPVPEKVSTKTVTEQPKQVQVSTPVAQTTPVKQPEKPVQVPQPAPVAPPKQPEKQTPVVQSTQPPKQPEKPAPVIQTTQQTPVKQAETRPVVVQSAPVNQLPVSSAVSNTGSSRRKWYRGIIEAGFGGGLPKYGMSNFRFNFINGIMLGRGTSIGLGLGYRRFYPRKNADWYLSSEKIQIPVFLDIRTTLSARRISPYLALGIGNSQGYGTTEPKQEGFFITPSAGIWFRISDRTALFTGVAYERQQLDYANKSDNIVYKENTNSISLNIGFAF